MALTRHPAAPDRPFMHWRHKAQLQLEQLEATPAAVLKARQVAELRRKLEIGARGQWTRKRK